MILITQQEAKLGEYLNLVPHIANQYEIELSKLSFASLEQLKSSESQSKLSILTRCTADSRNEQKQQYSLSFWGRCSRHISRELQNQLEDSISGHQIRKHELF